MQHTFAIIATISTLCVNVQSHSKIVCTNVRLQGGVPLACDGQQSLGSFVNAFQGWNFNDTSALNKVKDTLCTEKDLLRDSKPISCLDVERTKVCPGVAPPEDKIAKVKPGQQVVVAWIRNTHVNSTVNFYWEGRNVPSDTSEPNVYDWINEKQRIGSYSYEVADMSPYGAPSKKHIFKAGDVWHEAVNRYVGAPDATLIYQTITLPRNMKKGLNRILFYWNQDDVKKAQVVSGTTIPPIRMDIHYFDCMYYLVVDDKPISSSPAAVPGQLRTTIFQKGMTSSPVSDDSYYVGVEKYSGQQASSWPASYKMTPKKPFKSNKYKTTIEPKMNRVKVGHTQK